MRKALRLGADVEVVKQALGLLQWFVETQHDGWKLIIERGDEQREVIFPRPLSGMNPGDHDWLTSIDITPP
ncbi:hypothetical protein HYV30_00790 [Candidatus Kaiserbacteria bacterium]|nr:hypothetical protein [Candidatus Kaiserbacteria bacterium]